MYIYQSPVPPEQGQWIQVFTKDPAISLTDAVKKQFLSGYDEKTCFVRKAIEDPQTRQLHLNYGSVEISYPQDPNDQNGPWWANADKCPKDYTTSNGISYFVMDKTHPDRYAYLSIGQYIIPASPSENNKPWQDTLEFLAR